MSKIYLQVRYEDKDEAKASGARWDAAAKMWYWWQDAGAALPEYLKKFAMADGAKSESALHAEISEIVARIESGIPAAISAARALMEASLHNREADDLGLLAIEHVSALSDEQIAGLALDLLAALIATDRKNMDRFLSGKSSDPVRAILSVFGPSAYTARDKLRALNGASAEVLVREALYRAGNEHALKIVAERLAAAKAKKMAEIEAVLGQIDTASIDLHTDEIVVAGHRIGLHTGMADRLGIGEIDGDSAVRLADDKKTHCAWLNQMESVQKINDALSQRYRTEIDAKAASFRPVRVERTPGGREHPDVTIYASDGRSAMGYMDGSELVIHTLGMHGVAYDNPAIVRIAREAQKLEAAK